MQFSIKRDKLLKSLNFVQGIVEKKNTLPILSNVLLQLKDKKLASKLRLKKAFGVDRTHGERKIPGMYETIDLGFNYRMSEIHAAIGI